MNKIILILLLASTLIPILSKANETLLVCEVGEGVELRDFDGKIEHSHDEEKTIAIQLRDKSIDVDGSFFNQSGKFYRDNYTRYFYEDSNIIYYGRNNEFSDLDATINRLTGVIESRDLLYSKDENNNRKRTGIRVFSGKCKKQEKAF